MITTKEKLVPQSRFRTSAAPVFYLIGLLVLSLVLICLYVARQGEESAESAVVVREEE